MSRFYGSVCISLPKSTATVPWPWPPAKTVAIDPH